MMMGKWSLLDNFNVNFALCNFIVQRPCFCIFLNMKLRMVSDEYWYLLIQNWFYILIYVFSEFTFDEDYEFMNECALCGRDFSTNEALLLHLAEHEICNDRKYLSRINFLIIYYPKYYFISYLHYHYRKSWFISRI